MTSTSMALALTGTARPPEVAPTTSPAPIDPIADQVDSLQMLAATTPEMALAYASISVERSGDRAREMATSDRRARGVARRSGIEHERDAADIRLASALVGAAVSAISSAVTLSGADKNGQLSATNGEYGKAIGAAGQALSGVIDRFAATEDLAAKSENLLADEAADRAQQSSQYADAIDRHSDKMMQGTDAVMQARHDARMAAIRG